ncbi:MAG: 50S ribosomal protein L29 [Rikenellaceae bacterium]|jgi:large subunit ribosomal protein L29|nr:50S ribosomal protein L29 [Rikenellaceae bacterium]MBQ5853129.1 50S ribosomal protein L29 [Rikenellaceae bacterium]MBQ5893512.1 50S ribosomal protein L29 [Rikenellaceae bacterium]MBQ7791366.1 50S ribosomal protein L29 [Rikenellaceae bacterium]MBR2049569.1 50S ribosomal protein L29 [Rikenellaceae bacterium]
MKSAEIKELTVQELTERIEAEKANLAQMKVQHAVSPVENSSLIKKSRRDIARMLTILGQKNSKC